MFDLTQTIHNVESAGDPWFIAITVCLILTIVCFKLLSSFDEKAKEGSLSEKTVTLGMDYREGRYDEREYYLKYKIDGVNSAGQPVTLFLTDI